MITAGERLYKARLKKGISLEEASKATKIKPLFLSSIEKGEYQKLPSPAYIYGFIKNYADYLNLPRKEIVALFRRDYNEQKTQNVLPESLIQKTEISLSGIKIQNLSIGLIILFIAILGFLVFQYRHAFLNPALEVYSPVENAKVSLGETIVAGKSDAGASVSIDNVVVPSNKEGLFQKKISLFPGKKEITIKSQNKFNRETVIKRHIEVKE